MVRQGDNPFPSWIVALPSFLVIKKMEMIYPDDTNFSLSRSKLWFSCLEGMLQIQNSSNDVEAHVKFL